MVEVWKKECGPCEHWEYKGIGIVGLVEKVLK